MAGTRERSTYSPAGERQDESTTMAAVDSSGQQSPRLASLTYPNMAIGPLPHLAAEKLTLAVRPASTQIQSQGYKDKYRIRGDHGATAPLPRTVAPGMAYETTRYWPIAPRNTQRFPHPPIDPETPRPRGVRRDASQLEDAGDMAPSGITPHGGIPGVAGHYSRAAPRSSFTYSGKSTQLDANLDPYDASQQSLRSLSVETVGNWPGSSHMSAFRSTPWPKAAQEPAGCNEETPNFMGVLDELPDAGASNAHSIQRQVARKPSRLLTTTIGLDGPGDNMASLQQPRQPPAVPEEHLPGSQFSANSSGDVAGLEPEYTPGSLSGFTNPQVEPPTTDYFQTSTGWRQPSIDAQLQRNFYTSAFTSDPRMSDTGYTLQPSYTFSPYATPDPSIPVAISDAPFTRRSLGFHHHRKIMPIKGAADAFNHPSRRSNSHSSWTNMPATSALDKCHSNSMQYFTIGQTPETFVPPFTLGRTPLSRPSDLLTLDAPGTSRSTQDSLNADPCRHFCHGSNARTFDPEHTRQDSRPTPDTSLSTAYGEQHYQELTSQGQFSGTTHVRSALGNSIQNFAAPAKQRIVTSYEDYQAPVSLYEIVPETTKCYYAQAWLDNMTSVHPPSPTLLPTDVSRPNVNHRFFHSTRGFISTGTSLSLIVLHNANDPWAHPTSHTKGTTTIGTYGDHWREDDWIHWVTFTPSLETWLTMMELKGYIKRIGEWRRDMQPREKRFHRAYWVAANRELLGNLLHRADVSKPTNLDRVEDDESPEITGDDDLDNECGPVSVEDARDAWDVVMDVAQGIGVTNLDHVVLGDPEAPLYDQLLRFDRLVRDIRE